MKYCFNCKETKPLNQFNKDRTRPDLHGMQCAKCSNANWRSNQSRYKESRKKFVSRNPNYDRKNYLVRKKLNKIEEVFLNTFENDDIDKMVDKFFERMKR